MAVALLLVAPPLLMCKNSQLRTFQFAIQPESCIWRCWLWHLCSCQCKKLNGCCKRGLEGRQLKWMRRKTGLRFFEPPQAGIPPTPPGTWSPLVSGCQHDLPMLTPGCPGNSPWLGGPLTFWHRTPPSAWSVNFHPCESPTKRVHTESFAEKV